MDWLIFIIVLPIIFMVAATYAVLKLALLLPRVLFTIWLLLLR